MSSKTTTKAKQPLKKPAGDRIVLTADAHKALLDAQASLGCRSLSETVTALAAKAGSQGITIDLAAIPQRPFRWFAATRHAQFRQSTCTLTELIRMACQASGSTPEGMARQAFITHCTGLALELLLGESSSLEVNTRLATTFGALHAEAPSSITVSMLSRRAPTNYFTARNWIIANHPAFLDS